MELNSPIYDEWQTLSVKGFGPVTRSNQDFNNTPRPICEFQVGIPNSFEARLILVYPNPK